MSAHLLREIQKLQKYMLNLGAVVEDSLRQSVEAMETRNPVLAQQVIENDRQIDLMELEVEEECLSLLALHQPVAHDLRYVVAVLKINRDLERIGDLSKNIAQQALALSNEPAVDAADFRLEEMAHVSQQMLKQALDAFVQLDEHQAKQVPAKDDTVDEIHQQIYAKAERLMVENPDQIGCYMRLVNTGRLVERASDHAVNIAKDVQYLISGDIVRHARKQSDSQARSKAHEILTGISEQ